MMKLKVLVTESFTVEKIFSDSVLITDEIIEKLEELSELAPLHNPANIVGIKEFKKALACCTSSCNF